MTLPDDIFDQNQANNNNISSIYKAQAAADFSLLAPAVGEPAGIL